MKLNKTILMAFASLIIASSAQAALGWTLDECTQHWGAQTFPSYKDELSLTSYFFSRKGYEIKATILDGKVLAVSYSSNSPVLFSKDIIVAILKVNAPDVIWTKLSDEKYGDENWDATIDRVLKNVNDQVYFHDGDTWKGGKLDSVYGVFSHNVPTPSGVLAYSLQVCSIEMSTIIEKKRVNENTKGL